MIKTEKATQKKLIDQRLDLIHAHLVRNLAIEKEDFDLITFTRAGASWVKVNREFGGALETWLAEINRSIAES